MQAKSQHQGQASHEQQMTMSISIKKLGEADYIRKQIFFYKKCPKHGVPDIQFRRENQVLLQFNSEQV